MRAVYPVSYAGFRWELGPMMDLSAPQYDVLTSAGEKAVWQALNELQPKKCSQNPNDPDCYQAIIGFIKEKVGDMQGWTEGAPTNVVVNDDEDMPSTVSHEVGHNWGLGDEYRGGGFCCAVNPPPPSYTGKGCDSSTATQCASSGAQEPPQGQGARVVASLDKPFEVGGRGALTFDLTSYMGAGAHQAFTWDTPDMYAQLFKEFKLPAAREGRLAEPVTLMEATGWLVTATGRIERSDPWYSFDSDFPFTQGTGPYRIQAEDAEGAVLAWQEFSIPTFAHTNPPRDLDEAPFETALPFPEGTVRFRILRGEEVLSEIPVSPSPPAVTSILIPAGDFNGVETIAWEGSDPDGDTLWYDLEYSDTGFEEDSILLAEGVSGTRMDVDFSRLPGGANARIKVVATDGVRAAEAVSVEFSVPLKTPEVFITAPAPGATYRKGDVVTLDGDAYDLQDEWLSKDGDLVWSSDRDGELGTGTLVFASGLSAGTHVITLTATNGHSLSATRSVEIAVAPPTPGDCDGDGQVSIGEVQKAINMFLGIQAVGCGVDCSGDGTVSIGEVQKVINAFLGIASSC
jgi:hypothetical protein